MKFAYSQWTCETYLPGERLQADGDTFWKIRCTEQFMYKWVNTVQELGDIWWIFDFERTNLKADAFEDTDAYKAAPELFTNIMFAWAKLDPIVPFLMQY